MCIPPIPEYGAGKADQAIINQFPQELQSNLEMFNERHKDTFDYVRRLYSKNRKPLAK